MLKTLKAKNYIPEIQKEFVLQDFFVRELRIIPSYEWIKNRSKQFDYDESFNNVGMMYPIVVTNEKPDWVQKRILPKNPHHADVQGRLMSGLYVHVGNKRVLYALEKGYDFIEGYFVSELKEKNLIQNLQHIPHKSIPK